MFKSCNDLGAPDGAGTYSLTFGLCKGLMASRSTRGRGLPATMVDPQDVPPPPHIWTMSLAAIDIYLDYSLLSLQTEGKINEICSSAGWCSEVEVEVGVEPLPYSHAMVGHESSNYFPELSNGHSISATLADNQPSSFFQLLSFGLQKLIFAGALKSPQIQISGKDTLQALSKLAPAIFNAGYRDVRQAPSQLLK